jgi:hypothetical protein
MGSQMSLGEKESRVSCCKAIPGVKKERGLWVLRDLEAECTGLRSRARSEEELGSNMTNSFPTWDTWKGSVMGKNKEAERKADLGRKVDEVSFGHVGSEFLVRIRKFFELINYCYIDF